MKKVISILATLSFLGCSSSSNNFTLKGKIAVFGSVPHTYIGIKDSKSNRIFKISNASKFNLNKLQNHTVQIKAKLEKEPIGPGFPAVISVVKIEK